MVVVGAGAIGLCMAFELHELGVGDVTVIEKRHVASASSGLAVGIIETQYLDPVPIAIRAYSMEFFSRLERDAGLPITRNGYLRLGHARGGSEAFERSVALQHEHGVADATRARPRRRSRHSCRAWWCDDILGGLYGPSDGFVDPALTCTIIAELVRAKGVTISQQTELVGADVGADGRHVLETSGGTLQCDHVVNAAGAWATPVGALAGHAR